MYCFTEAPHHEAYVARYHLVQLSILRFSMNRIDPKKSSAGGQLVIDGQMQKTYPRQKTSKYEAAQYMRPTASSLVETRCSGNWFIRVCCDIYETKTKQLKQRNGGTERSTRWQLRTLQVLFARHLTFFSCVLLLSVDRCM